MKLWHVVGTGNGVYGIFSITVSANSKIEAEKVARGATDAYMCDTFTAARMQGCTYSEDTSRIIAQVNYYE